MKQIRDSLQLLFAGPAVINVRFRGGDLQTRLMTAAVVLGLVILVAPPAGIPDSTIRIATLSAAIFGTIFLMTGLVF